MKKNRLVNGDYSRDEDPTFFSTDPDPDSAQLKKNPDPAPDPAPDPTPDPT